MKKALLVLLPYLIAMPAQSAPVEATTDAGNFAISVVMACGLIKDRGYTGESLKKGLITETGMDEESASNLAGYASGWVDKNPGKNCEQIYVSMIDKYYRESPKN